MNENWQALCALLRCTLFQISSSLPQQINWNEVLQILRHQGVESLISSSTEVVNLAPAVVQNHLKSIAERQVFEYYRFLSVEDELTSLFQTENIPIEILKGIASSVYYPHPEYRSLGDIDFLVPPAHFEKAKELLLKNGYQNASGDYSENRHFILQKDGITYEMHRYFTRVESDQGIKQMDVRIQQAASRPEMVTIAGCSIPRLPDAENGWVILQHISQHLMQSLTLKQLLDWIMYVAVVCDDQYWETTFAEIAEASGLKTLAITVARIGQLYFGLPEEGHHWCCEADEDLCRCLMDQVMEGKADGTDSASNVVASVFVRSDGIVGLFRNLQSCGKTNWAHTLEKYPFLSPFAWLYQACRYAHRGLMREKPLQALKQDRQKAKERTELYKRLGIK